MYNFKSLPCYNCDSVIINLPELEINKLNGLTFLCECCGHQNMLQESKFLKVFDADPLLNICSCETLIAI
jgi:hypothetical protein